MAMPRKLKNLNLFNDGNGWTGLGASVARHQLVVDGNAGDVLNVGGDWYLRNTVPVSGHFPVGSGDAFLAGMAVRTCLISWHQAHRLKLMALMAWLICVKTSSATFCASLAVLVWHRWCLWRAVH